jgi:hypothetical protein
VFFVPLVAMLSVFDQWFHVRERWKQQIPQKGEKS